ncbi:MAG TPA: amidohydrolase [Candidatus Eremiobacteraeota bacterium]|nr:amidohydrolase [Candidatus Eremiobacteraeota bacterium]
MSILIRNVTAITLDEKNTLHSDVNIAIEGKDILSIGDVPKGFQPARVIDGRDFVAIPAFFNCHTHAAMTLERGWAEDLPFDRWLNEKIWLAESAMEREDVYWGAALACCEMIRSGTVGFADHYFYMDQVAKAVSEAGMKATLAWCQFGIGKEQEVGGVILEDTLSFIREWHGAGEGKIRCVLGPHSPYMCPPEFLRRVVECAGELNTGIHLHLSESEEQVKNSISAYKKTPVEHLSHLGVFDRYCIAAHCITVSDEDIAILAEKGVYVAHTPKTYMKLAMGMSSLDKLLKGGVKVGLGTDGPGSNNDLNILEVMRITGLVHKNRMLDPAAFPNDLILRLATEGSARALGFEKSGVLERGASADIILLNTRKSHWIPRHNPAANIVYSSHPGDIDYLICDGRLLLDRGKLITLDEERIHYEAEKRAFRMVGKPMSQVRTYRG